MNYGYLRWNLDSAIAAGIFGCCLSPGGEVSVVVTPQPYRPPAAAVGILDVPTLTLAVVTTFHTALAKSADAQTKAGVKKSWRMAPGRGMVSCIAVVCD